MPASSCTSHPHLCFHSDCPAQPSPTPASHPRAGRPTWKTKQSLMENRLVWEGEAKQRRCAGRSFSAEPLTSLHFPLCLLLCRSLADLGLGQTRAGLRVRDGTGDRGTGPARRRLRGPATPPPLPLATPFPSSNPHPQPCPPPPPAGETETPPKALGTRGRTAALCPFRRPLQLS